MLWIIISVYTGYGTNSGINIIRKCLSAIDKFIRISYNSILFDDKMQQSFDEGNNLNCIDVIPDLEFTAESQ